MASGCRRCGRPTPGRADTCSTGCFLASRLPGGEQGLPASWQLGVALGWGFLLFNQWLFLAMTHLAADRGKLLISERFEIAALLCGVATLLVNLALLGLASPKRWTDAAVVLIIAAGPLGLLLVSSPEFSAHRDLLLAIVNSLLAAWLVRGLLRRRP